MINNVKSTAERKEEHKVCSKLLHEVISKLKWCIHSEEYVTQKLKEYIERFLTLCQYGFFVRDAANVVCLIETLSSKFTGCLQYRSWIIHLLQIARFCPVLCSPIDFITYEADLTEYFSMFGDVLLWAPDKEILDTVCVALSSIFLKDIQCFACLPRYRCIELLAKSRLPSTLVDLMAISDFPEYATLLACIEAILQSNEVGYILLKADILNIMLKNIGAPAIYHKTPTARLFTTPIPAYFPASLRILWQLGRIISQTPRKQLLSLNVYITGESWRFCHGMFRKLILSRHMKTVRNSYFASVLHIVMFIPGISKISTLFAQDWAMLIAATEMGTFGTWASSVVFNNDPAEYDFKKMLLVSVRICEKHPYISRSMIQREVYQSIFNIVTPQVQVIWTKDQRSELMVYALGALSYVIKGHIKEFLFNLGPCRLITMVRNVMDEKLPLAVLLPSLRCIHVTLTTDVRVAKRYRRRGGFDTLLGLAGLYVTAVNVNTDVQQIIIILFCILGMFQRYTKFRGTTLDISISCLNTYLKPGHTILHPNVLIVVLDYLWATVTYYKDAPELFVELGGVFVVLDVLQKAPLLIKTIILGFVTDLCLYNIMLPLLLVWRGEGGVTLTDILLDIFRKENKLIGITLADSGIITDLECPLMGTLQKSLLARKLREGLCSSPCVLDMYGSCRPKVCAILTLLNYQKASPINLINQAYAIQLKPLTRKDEMTMCVAKNYFALKTGECWVELNNELQAEGVFLLAVDQQLIAAHMDAYYDIIIHIKNNQLQHRIHTERKECAEEQLFYKMLRETTKPTVLDCLKELSKIKRCSVKSDRVAEKQKQRRELMRSLGMNKYSKQIAFHPTFAYNTDVSHVFSHQVNIKTNTTMLPISHPSLVSVIEEDHGYVYKKADSSVSLYSL